MTGLSLANNIVLFIAGLNVIFSRQLGTTVSLMISGFVAGYFVQRILCLLLR